MFSPQPPPPPYDPDEEERLARAKQALPAITVPPNAVPPPGPAPVAAVPLTAMAAPPTPPLPTLAQDPATAAPTSTPTVETRPGTVTQPTTEPTSEQKLASMGLSGIGLAPTATAATPTAPVRRMPLSVTDQVGPMPDRNAERYQPVGRLKSGFQNLRYAPPTPISGGTPGFMAGEALGGLAGKFLGGVISPGGAAENKYQRDLQLWQAKQEAASKAATEEASRAHVLSQATHRDPYTGEVDPYYQATIDQKHAAAAAQTSRANTYALKAQTDIDKLKETTKNHILNALKGGAIAPTPEMEQELAVNGMRYVPPAQKGGLGKIEQKGIDENGRPVTRYFVWDKRTGAVRPMTHDVDGSVIEVPGHGSWGVPIERPRTETGGPTVPGVTTRPGETGGPAFELPGAPAKGAGDFGAFRTQQEMDRSYQADAAAYQAYQQNYRALDQIATRLEAQRDSIDEDDVFKQPQRVRLQSEALTARDKAIAAQKDWKTHEAKIKGNYPPGYVEIAPGDGGWYYIKNHPDKVEAKSAYPIGGEQTRKTGKIDGYKPLRPGLLNPSASPQQ